MADDLLTVPASESELADFIYEVSNVTDAEEKAEFLWAHISRLTAERNGLQGAVDVLESNARVQAKLLADTGRERDGMRKALEPNFTFDDSHFGRSDNQRISLTEKLVARPDGLHGLDWFEFAGKLAAALNALATTSESATGTT